MGFFVPILIETEGFVAPPPILIEGAAFGGPPRPMLNDGAALGAPPPMFKGTGLLIVRGLEGVSDDVGSEDRILGG